MPSQRMNAMPSQRQPSTSTQPASEGAQHATRDGTQRAATEGAQRARCVVVGYDGSPEARYAAGWAARSVGEGGRLVLINACRPRHGWISQAVLLTASERRERAGALMDELLMDVDGLLDVNVESAVLDEEPAKALVGAALQHGADEIVVGSHHRARLDAVRGDVASELVHTSPVPVCVVPLGGEPA